MQSQHYCRSRYNCTAGGLGEGLLCPIVQKFDVSCNRPVRADNIAMSELESQPKKLKEIACASDIFENLLQQEEEEERMSTAVTCTLILTFSH